VASDPVRAGCAPSVPRRAGRAEVCAGQRDREQPPPVPCAQVRILLAAQVKGIKSNTLTTSNPLPRARPRPAETRSPSPTVCPIRARIPPPHSRAPLLSGCSHPQPLGRSAAIDRCSWHLCCSYAVPADTLPRTTGCLPQRRAGPGPRRSCRCGPGRRRRSPAAVHIPPGSPETPVPRAGHDAVQRRGDMSIGVRVHSAAFVPGWTMLADGLGTQIIQSPAIGHVRAPKRGRGITALFLLPADCEPDEASDVVARLCDARSELA